MNWKNLVSLAPVAVLTAICAAQTTPGNHVFVNTTSERGGYKTVNELKEIVARLDKEKLKPVVSGSWEYQVLNGAKKAASWSLQISLDEAKSSGIYTLSTNEGDTLIARWTGVDSGRPEKAVWLWDTPFYTTFVMEVNPTILLPDELVHYCEGLFLWNKFINLTSMQLFYLPLESGTQQAAIGLGKYDSGPLMNALVWFVGLPSKDIAYVAVGMSKPIFATAYPPEADRVRERFPPLQSRLQGVPREDLFAELGRGYESSRRVTYPKNRDTIVLGELLSRGPVSDTEIRQILIGSFRNGTQENGEVLLARLNAFLDALAYRNQLAAYSTPLEHFFLDGPTPQDWIADAMVGRAFLVMKLHDIDSSKTALAFAEQSKFVRPSLFYLEQNAHDEETLQKLSAINLKPEFQDDKEHAVNRIEYRLHSQRKAR